MSTRLVILAAGFANTLPPQTLTRPKALVSVAGRTILDRLLDSLLPIGDLEEAWIVSNRRFAPQFREWARRRKGGLRTTVVDDGSTGPGEALGALGDLRLALERCGCDGDLVVAAGDNLFSQTLEDFGDRCRRVASPVLAVYDVGRLESARQYSAVHTDMDGRITSFVEKPKAPDTTLIGIGLYYYPAGVLPMIAGHLATRAPGGKPGELVQWLYPRLPVHTWTLPGIWFDIGSPETLDEAGRILGGAPFGQGA